MDRAQIEARYRSDLDAAEAYREANPQRYYELREQASDRRATALTDLADAADARARESDAANWRNAARAKYPLADPGAIAGATEAEIEASAKRSHDHVESSNKTALESARLARRPETQRQWTGAQGGRPGMPGGDAPLPTTGATERVQRAYDRTANTINEARKPGPIRRYDPDTQSEILGAQDPEAAAIHDYHVLHPRSGLSVEAFVAKAEGTVTYGPGDQDPRLSAEDARG